MEINTKNILVTGGSQGLGATLCRRFAQSGAHVFVNCAHNRAGAAALSAEIGGVPAVFDISDAASVEAFFAENDVDILVNNARFDPFRRTAEMTDAAFFDACVGVNLKGPYLCSLAAIAALKRRSAIGAIVNISSVWAVRAALPPMLEYAMTKAALESLTRSLALLAAPHGITVNAVAPGLIRTDALSGRKTIEEVDTMCRNIPLGRWSEPDEIAEAVEFLIRCSSATGSVLPVDGGAALNRTGGKKS